MYGSLIKGKPKTREQFSKVVFNQRHDVVKNFPDIFQTFRGIEAEWEEEEKRTVITATWGGEDFDIRKTLPVNAGGTTEDVATDPEIPVCPGCERLTRFAGASTDEDHIAHIFSTDSHINTIVGFYERALPARGWQETEASSLTRKMKQHAQLDVNPDTNRQFVRDGKYLTLSVSFDAAQNKTFVSLNNSN
jgi:hypothetical protein